jgi:hypothetical protein
MARCNAFLEAGSDSGRRVSVGGRRAQTSVWAHLNTDNSTHSDCALRVSASVVGTGTEYKERRRKDGDQRRSLFSIDCPEQNDEYCAVDIRANANNDHIRINGTSIKELWAAAELVRALKESSGEETFEALLRHLDQHKLLAAS